MSQKIEQAIKNAERASMKMLIEFSEEFGVRDYFAAKSLPFAWKAFEDGYFDSDDESINASVAACAYQLADAMILERAK